MKTPLLSILIPTRNRGAYVGFAVESCLNISCKEIEVLVSDNHSDDDTASVLSKFNDSRLRVFSPPSPLAMHENWEFLLNKANGEWVYVLGDDDAIFPYVVAELKAVASEFPWIEAIVSPRAYYFWEGCAGNYPVFDFATRLNAGKKVKLKDSKLQLKLALRGKLSPRTLPQLYSGGFQKNTLVERVRNSQGGRYFGSVMPDSYSAVVACIYTANYLEIGLPLALVGTSPRLPTMAGASVTKKNFVKDFFDFLPRGGLAFNPLVGRWQNMTPTMFFYESYIQAMPSDYKYTSKKFLKKLYLNAVSHYILLGNTVAVRQLSEDFGFPIPSPRSFAILLNRLRTWIKRFKGMLGVLILSRLSPDIRITSKSYAEFPDIRHAVDRGAGIYEQLKKN